jgi:hypothetical protein
MDLHHLAPVLLAGGSFVSLAYQNIQSEIARWNIDHHEQVYTPVINNDGDYEDWVALIAEMDHVITVTTTVAHVCGALGKKAWVMVNQLPQWRYCVHMDDGGMIWYPQNSVHLYRQKPGEVDWAHCVSRVAKDYAAFILGK